jgi:transcriptional regulator GlxA family with amidase domain
MSPCRIRDPMNANITIGILIFEDAEELDFVGPFEVFGMAAEFGESCRPLIISESTEVVRCAHGLRVLPDYAMDDAPPLDLLLVPGGRGARVYAARNERILQFVRQQQKTVASVCTGAIVLAAAGVLDGIEATTHCEHYDQLRSYERVRLREGARFVMHDRLATSAGVTAGIDLALAFVSRFFGEAIAERIAKNLEWQSDHWRLDGKD